jgi:hypothetical protein
MLPTAGVVSDKAEDALREIKARSTTTYYAENFVKAALDMLQMLG